MTTFDCKNIYILLIVFILTFLFASCLFSQDSEENEYISYELKYHWDEFINESTIPRGLPVRITFDNLPHLNEKFKVKVEILVPENFDNVMHCKVEEQYNMTLSPFIIRNKPYKTPDLVGRKYGGKILMGEFEITPLEIGRYYIYMILNYDPERKRHNHTTRSFGFILDESGNCIYLNNKFNQPEIELPNHPPLNADKIVLRYRENYYDDSDYFCEFTISPPLAINQKSDVEVYIRSNVNIAHNLRFSAHYSTSVKVTKFLNDWEKPILKGDEYRGTFQIMPTEVGGSYILFYISNELYRIDFAFDKSGKLFYLGIKSLRNWYDEKNRDKFNELGYTTKREKTFSVQSKSILKK